MFSLQVYTKVWANLDTNSITSELPMEMEMSSCGFAVVPVLCWGSRGEIWGSSGCFLFLTFLLFRLSFCLSMNHIPRVRWDLCLCTLHPGGTDDQMRAWESGAVALWPCAMGATIPILLPHPSLPSSQPIRVVWKTFLSAGGGNLEIRWAMGRLLGLLQGTGSSPTPLILPWCVFASVLVCMCVCVSVRFSLYSWIHVAFFSCNNLTAWQKKKLHSSFHLTNMCSQNTHDAYLQTICHILENL